MELRQSVLQDIALLLDNDQAMEKLHKYVKRLRADAIHHADKAPCVTQEELAPMMSVTQEELDRYIQEAAEDDEFATEEEVSQFYGRWGCVK